MLGINSHQSDLNIHEIALKTLINICKYNNESLEDMDLKDFFSIINNLFNDFSFLSQQYSFRFITILINLWNDKKIEEYLVEILKVMSKFILNCKKSNTMSMQLKSGVKEMKYITIIIERISLYKQLLKQIADKDYGLFSSISEFISEHYKQEEYEPFIENFLKFCK
jgi:uncharacterized UBP type Zn finger protein